LSPHLLGFFKPRFISQNLPKQNFCKKNRHIAKNSISKPTPKTKKPANPLSGFAGF